MTKVELVAQIAQEAGLKNADAEKALNSVLMNITQELGKGGSIGLAGLGTFSVSKRAARKGRNPKTGEEINIPASKSVKFKAGKTLKEEVN
ncbi:MAG: HU family DNA-binding protein [Thermodesulfobacteriota bacterium]